MIATLQFKFEIEIIFSIDILINSSTMDPLSWTSPEEISTTTTNVTTNVPIVTTPTNVTNVTVSGGNSRGLSFDFTNSNTKRSLSLADSLEMKKFMIRRAESSIESPIVFERERLDDIFNKIGRKFRDIKRVKDITLEYSIPLSNDSRRTFFICNDEDALENLEIFYAQAEEMSPYPLIAHVKKLDRRTERPKEILYKTMMKKKFSCDNFFYKMLVENLDIAIQFKRTRELINVVMGRKCVNLLSPGHFYCHIRGCKKILTLGGFSKLHIIERHWHEHQAGSSDSQFSCADLSLRYAFLKTSGGKLWYSDFSGTFEEKIAQMETMMYEGKNLTAVEGNFNYISNDSKFEGRPFLVDEDILDGIINGDRDTLSKIPKQVTIMSYFSHPREHRSKNSSSRTLSSSTITTKSPSPVCFTRITPVVTGATTTGSVSDGKGKHIQKKKSLEKESTKKLANPLKRLHPPVDSDDE